MEAIHLTPIGVIHTPFEQAAGTPIQPAKANGAKGWIELDDAYCDGLKDLDGFDRIWLLFWCHRASGVNLRVKPYMDTETRGLFATRAPSRPNAIGLSCVKLLRVDGNRLEIEDVDMLNGTPLLDIKPYITKFDHFNVSRCGWTDSPPNEHTQADNRFFNEDKS
jgi:tRNA-Thr(GGU) m(6)t(6)A37 methyltransferase TsaA